VIIADTNVVSEFMRTTPDPVVLAWAAGIAPAGLGVTVVTVEEIERGVRLLAQGRRRRELERQWAGLLESFASQVAVYDVAAARETAALLVAARAAGRPMSLADAQIAGICLSGGHSLATRNTQDFAGVAGLTVTNPFTASTVG
jgi:predicted nucleic acid-binding protein